MGNYLDWQTTFKVVAAAENSPDLAAFHVQETLHQDGPLHHQSGHEQCIARGTVSVFAQKGHQKAKANEYHDLNILKFCNKARVV